MNDTRRQIIDLLKERGQATVEELAGEMSVTCMAIRHHLNVLLGENLIDAETERRQNGPGRPQKVYRLTETANDLFPTNYHDLASSIIYEIKADLGQEYLDGMLERIAARWLQEAPKFRPDQPVEERLEEAIAFLGEKGFQTTVEKVNGGYYLHNLTCPYHYVVMYHPEVCKMDVYLFNKLLNTRVQPRKSIAAADQRCTYYIELEKNGT